jgi:hypothetical protein
LRFSVIFSPRIFDIFCEKALKIIKGIVPIFRNALGRVSARVTNCMQQMGICLVLHYEGLKIRKFTLGNVHIIRSTIFRIFRPPSSFVTKNRTNPYLLKRLRNKSLNPPPLKNVTYYVNDTLKIFFENISTVSSFDRTNVNFIIFDPN